MFAKSVNTGLPEISLPIAIGHLGHDMLVFPITRLNVPGTIWYFNTNIWFTRNNLRTEAIDIERAKSREILVTLSHPVPSLIQSA